MKKFLICAVLYLLGTNICANANTGGKNNSAALPEGLRKNVYRHIVGVIPVEKNSFEIVMSGQPSPRENYLGVVTCDVKGQIRCANEFVIPRILFVSSTADPNMPLVWLGSSGWRDKPELCVAERDGTKLQRRLLLKRGKDDPLLCKCWVLEVGGKKRLFTAASETKLGKVKGQSYFDVTHWLSCYAFDDYGLKLEGKVLLVLRPQNKVC